MSSSADETSLAETGAARKSSSGRAGWLMTPGTLESGTIPMGTIPADRRAPASSRGAPEN